MASLSQAVFLVMKSSLSVVNIAVPAFFWLVFTGYVKNLKGLKFYLLESCQVNLPQIFIDAGSRHEIPGSPFYWLLIRWNCRWEMVAGKVLRSLFKNCYHKETHGELSPNVSFFSSFYFQPIYTFIWVSCRKHIAYSWAYSFSLIISVFSLVC